MDTDLILDQVKLFKGIQDNQQDELIALIIDDSVQRILAEVNLHTDETVTDLPKSVDYIVRDVAIKRYNKIDSEGATSDSEEGRSFNWEDGYLDEYRTVLANLMNKKLVRGQARFL